MLKLKLLALFFFGSTGFCSGQEKFYIQDDGKSTRINFELVNNLIIIPVELNGVELTFLVDTGVKTTLLLNLDEKDSLEINGAEKIQLRGLGGEELIEAFRSRDNKINLGKVKHDALTVYVIYDENVNFSPRLGVPVHGIIGYDLFRDFVVEINYSGKYIRLHDPVQFSKKLRKYQSLPLEFFQGKPYLKSLINIEGREEEATLLIDNGLSDALWLFPDDKGIKVPERSFTDFLGLGLLGDVTGERSRIRSLELGRHALSEVTTSFPDNLSVEGLQTYHLRKGSIGSEILRRFNVIFDYRNNRLYLKKNKWFSEPFNYNMSGIVLEHGGFIMIETYEKIMQPNISGSEEDNLLIIEPAFYKKFQLKPSFRIARVREGSPAFFAGLQVGDEIVKINGKNAYKLGIEDFTALFSSKEGKLIKMLVQRGGRNLKFRFRLKEPVDFYSG